MLPFNRTIRKATQAELKRPAGDYIHPAGHGRVLVKKKKEGWVIRTEIMGIHSSG